MVHKIDVLICAHNEALHIPRVLESLRLQSVSTNIFRVIFVDNASTDRSRQVVQENAHGLNLKYVYETTLGLNYARNTGYQHAEAPYVAHIDADAKADTHWLESILQVIEQERPDLCGGPYFPYYTVPKPKWFLDRYNSNYLGDKPHYLEEYEYLSGTNMIWRRSIVEQLGGFRVDVGLTGRGFTRGDETNLIVRARKEIPNFKAFYHPNIIVYHLTRPETFSLWYWVCRSFSQGRHSHAVWNQPQQRYSRRWALVQLLRTATVVTAKGVKAFVHRNRVAYPYWQNYWYERVLPEVYTLGILWGVIGRSSAY